MFSTEFWDGEWVAHRKFRTEASARTAIARDPEAYALGWRLTDGTGRVLGELRI